MDRPPGRLEATSLLVLSAVVKMALQGGGGFPIAESAMSLCFLTQWSESGCFVSYVHYAN